MNQADLGHIKESGGAVTDDVAHKKILLQDDGPKVVCLVGSKFLTSNAGGEELN